METIDKINVFWFRRDLRLEDNTGLFHALRQDLPVLLIFIFDQNILDDLDDPYDLRVKFIHQQIFRLNNEIKKYHAGILTKYGIPLQVFKKLIDKYKIENVYCNEDYEPYATSRDKTIGEYLKDKGIGFFNYKDHVIFHKSEILNKSGEPYKVYTPYKNRWLEQLRSLKPKEFRSEDLLNNLVSNSTPSLIPLKRMGFRDQKASFPERKFDTDIIKNYHQTREFPYVEGTSRAGIHLRHGTLSIRKAVKLGDQYNETWLNELIWREFYSMILYHYPEVVKKSFKSQYDHIQWLNNEEDFDKWKEGCTGYPIVDAGMRQLNQTGYMHNRLRMITASFLTKHLLIDWRWGEAYFAKKLLDYELASNNGGWQWAAGTGTDAQPYFRIFNPYEQARKFDPDSEYVREWLPDHKTDHYIKPIIDHKFARKRAITAYKRAING